MKSTVQCVFLTKTTHKNKEDDMDFFKEIRMRLGSTRTGQKDHPKNWSADQVRVFERLQGIADEWQVPQGISRRQFLKTQIGMAAFFMSMNHVFGTFFAVSAAERAGQGSTTDRFSDQFIFDVQVHFVHEDYPNMEQLLELREEAEDWNPRLKGESHRPADIEFDNFYREVFENSQTKMAVLSNAPADKKEEWFISNDQAMKARRMVNERAGSRRLLAHWVFTPGQPGWMEDLDRGLEAKPDAWKGYTLGDAFGRSQYQWRLDDEKMVYPAFEKMQKAGIRNICIHKGLLPEDYEKKFTAEQIRSSRVDDLGKAARDWPNLNFIIYHAAIEKHLPEREDVEKFRKTGRIAWVTDLAEIPEKYGVKNVYGEIGSTFAATAVAHPELCAGMLGTLIRGLGESHVCWGTDSVWYGSPQWQIEAMRRIEIPERMQRQHGFRPLGQADSRVRRMIFGENSARLYGI
jgi:uncharacterized protein